MPSITSNLETFTPSGRPMISPTKSLTTAELAVTTPAQRVADTPDILQIIMGFVDDREANDLARCLRVSTTFFEAASYQLCRRITIPAYEFSVTTRREEIFCARACPLYYGEEQYLDTEPNGSTRHFPHGVKHSRAYIESVNSHYRLIHQSSIFTRRMYQNVRVLIIEPHSGCSRLADYHPLPNVHTVIARGSQARVCTPSDWDQTTCAILPTSPFRLVLDGCCRSLVCGSCTSSSLLSPSIDTLVVRLRMDYDNSEWCSKGNLPPDCRPRRLVIMFPSAKFRSAILIPDLNRGGYQYDSAIYPPEALKPEDANGDMKMYNWFYWMAACILTMPDECEVLVVGADHAISLRGLPRYDDSLPPDPELHTRQWGRMMNPATFGTANLVHTSGQSYFSYDTSWLGHNNQSKKHAKSVQGPGPECNVHACYGQSGRIFSARITRGPIAPDQIANAASIIHRRVAVIESILRAWVDKLLDRTLEPPSWEAEKEDWVDRRDFERYYRYLKAEKKGKKELDAGRKWVEEEKGSRTRTSTTNSSRANGLSKDLGTSGEGKGLTPKDELEARRKLKHKNIRFITLHQYHRLEGNKDEMDDPSSYL